MASPTVHYGRRPTNVRRRAVPRARQPAPRTAAQPRLALAPARLPAARPARVFRPKPRPITQRWTSNPLLLAAVVVPVVALVSAVMIFSIGAVMMLASGRTLPGVYAGGVALGGLTQAQAEITLAHEWSTRGIVVQDQDRRVPVDPAVLGVTLDVDATARMAADYGRTTGGIGGALRAAFGRVNLAPVVTVDLQAAGDGLRQIAEHIEQPAVNAGVQLVGGVAQPRAAVPGRRIDVGATLAQLGRDPSATLAAGTLDLVMITVQPAVTDAGPLVAAASALLSSPFQIRAYDPIRDAALTWTLAPDEWGAWLVAQPDSSSSTGLKLSLDAAALNQYLSRRQAELGETRYLKIDDAVRAVEDDIAAGRTTPTIRVYHHDTHHIVQSGETIVTIAWDNGVPYPWIEAANPGVDNLSVGQTITIPSADHFLDLPVVYDKRVVVSITEQRAWVYENGNLKWEWIVSTGIDSSPTWPGLYQIIEHVDNAYAGNWNLWMPHFLGVYRPIPGSDFTNGFHGFPTRGSSQLLWTNSLGTRVTYGCILLSNENAAALYDWAQDGVVVEIRA